MINCPVVAPPPPNISHNTVKFEKGVVRKTEFIRKWGHTALKQLIENQKDPIREGDEHKDQKDQKDHGVQKDPPKDQKEKNDHNAPNGPKGDKKSA